MTLFIKTKLLSEDFPIRAKCKLLLQFQIRIPKLKRIEEALRKNLPRKSKFQLCKIQAWMSQKTCIQSRDEST